MRTVLPQSCSGSRSLPLLVPLLMRQIKWMTSYTEIIGLARKWLRCCGEGRAKATPRLGRWAGNRSALVVCFS